MYEGSTLLIGGQTGLDPSPDGAPKQVETPAALSRIAESEEVVSKAIDAVGVETLVPDLKPNTLSLFARLRARIFPSTIGPERPLTALEAFLPRIRLGLTVRNESNSDVIRIAYRHRDPDVAARFANAVAQAFVDRQALLYSRPGAANFFLTQQQRFEGEAKRAYEDLNQFATRTSVYAADDQRLMLLKRLDDLVAASALTRVTMAQKLGQRQTLADELRKLAPVSRSPYVSSLVDALGGDRGSAGSRGNDTRALDERSADPPILLVRVYQDTMVELFKINAELVGAQSLQKEQADEITQLKGELNALSHDGQEFARLERAISRATYNADVYSKRMVEEQIDAESRAARFSSIKVMQRATVPLRPVSPNYIMYSAIALVLSGLAAVAVTLLRGARR